LVHQQICRIHEWSKANAEARRPGIVKDWELIPRKREQKRLADLSSTNRKRHVESLFEDDDNDDDNEDDVAVVTRPSHVLTAVPQWLLDCCGKGYTTKQILEIFNKLHAEILDGNITHFPDIEILPNIITDPNIPKSPKGYAKRTATSTHRRTKSLGAAIQSNSASPISQSNQSSVWNEDAFGSPKQKRRRPSGLTEESFNEEAFDERTSTRSRHGERPVDTGRRMPQLSHRPVFPDIRENQREEYGDGYYAGSPSTYQTPLPAPTPQRSNGHSMAAHLENNNGYSPTVRRSLHGRSCSDISDFGHNQIEYAPPSNGFGMDTTHQTRQLQVQDRGRSGYGYSIPQHYPHQQYRDESPAAGRWSEPRIIGPLPRQGHHRHQSTPQNPCAAPPLSYGRQSQHPNHPIPQHNNNSPFISRRIQETDETRNLCSVRR
jgi:hypothetical protein